MKNMKFADLVSRIVTYHSVIASELEYDIHAYSELGIVGIKFKKENSHFTASFSLHRDTMFEFSDENSNLFGYCYKKKGEDLKFLTFLLTD